MGVYTSRRPDVIMMLRPRRRPEEAGPWWFRTVTVTTPDGRKTLVIWRKRPGGETAEGVEQDNLVLDAPDDTWKVRLIEEDFHRLMFDTEGV